MPIINNRSLHSNREVELMVSDAASSRSSLELTLRVL
jgi:hypothetical protein